MSSNGARVWKGWSVGRILSLRPACVASSSKGDCSHLLVTPLCTPGPLPWCPCSVAWLPAGPPVFGELTGMSEAGPVSSESGSPTEPSAG